MLHIINIIIYQSLIEYCNLEEKNHRLYYACREKICRLETKLIHFKINDNGFKNYENREAIRICPKKRKS